MRTTSRRHAEMHTEREKKHSARHTEEEKEEEEEERERARERDRDRDRETERDRERQRERENRRWREGREDYSTTTADLGKELEKLAAFQVVQCYTRHALVRTDLDTLCHRVQNPEEMNRIDRWN